VGHITQMESTTQLRTLKMVILNFPSFSIRGKHCGQANPDSEKTDRVRNCGITNETGH